MSGFTNAPEIDRFARGMEVNYRMQWATWDTVVYVYESGSALLRSNGTMAVGEIPFCHLRHDSVWEGQVRRAPSGTMATVKAIADSIDLMVYWVDGQGPYSDTKGGFVKHYSHVVLPELPKTLTEIALDLARNLQYQVNLETTARYIEKKLRGYGVTVQGQDDE